VEVIEGLLEKVDDPNHLVAAGLLHQSINVTPVAMKLKKLMPAIHWYHGDSQTN
jgi:hypothetical protein